MSESTLTNSKFAESDEKLNVACGLAGIPPTKRQASKFRRGLGSAHAAMSSFIGGGYVTRRDHLQSELTELKKQLESATARLEKLEDKSSKEAKAVSSEIEGIEGRIKDVESKLGNLKAKYETLMA